MPEPTPEAWAKIRHDYEHTDRPLAHICAEHDVTLPTMRYRMKVWEWKRRKPLIPRYGPPPVTPVTDDVSLPAERTAQGEEELGSVCHDGLAPSPDCHSPSQTDVNALVEKGKRHVAEGADIAIVPRLQGMVARMLPAIEATIARLAAGTQHPREMEQAGRALSALTRALRELNALLSQHKADDDAPSPQDMDEFRRELSRRLRGIIEARKAAKALET
jgi:hypothetical protein